MVWEQVLSPGASITSIVACVEPGEVFVLLGVAYRYHTPNREHAVFGRLLPLVGDRCCRYMEARTEDSIVAKAP